jgi:hypothetical protein
VKRFFVLTLATLTVSAALAQSPSPSATPSMPPPAKPTKQHEWLKQFEGEWKAEGEMSMGPGQPKVKSTGLERARMLGEFFLIADGEGECMGQKAISHLQIGYDEKKKKFVGTFTMNADPTFWIYDTGQLDKSGKALSLECTGPNLITQKGTARYRETWTMVDADHRTFHSEILGKGGKATKMVEIKYERVKK